MIIWAAAVLTFFAVFSILAAVYYSPAAKRRFLSRRIQDLTQGSAPREFGSKEPISYKTLLRNLSRVIAPKGLAARFENDLIKAGVLLRGEEAVTLWLLLLVIPPAIVLVLSRDLVAALLVMALACALPFFLLRSATAKRIARFNNQISDALVIIANSLRAGFSFLQALEMVEKEMGDPMSSEVRRVLREMHLGVPTEQALVNMGERVGSDDFDMVITAILIQRQVGGNLAEVLDNISGTIRGRIQLGREVKVLTAQGKMSGLIIGVLPLVLCILLYFMNREYILILFTDPRGMLLLGIGVTLQIFGLIIIRKIVDIQM